MNLVVTDKCTNHCPYCFASTEMGKSQNLLQLSKENIEVVIDFIKKNDPNFNLNIIGGEPFLYKHLDYLLEKLINEPNFGKATIFTGGIFKIEKLFQLKPFVEKINFLFNLNEKHVYNNEKEYNLVIQNLLTGIELGIQTNIGINIYRTKFNFDEVLAICHKFGIEHLRWTIACPQINPSPDVKVLYPHEYKGIAPKIMTFLEKAYKLKINAYLDCPLPKCFFTEEQLGRLSLIQPQVVASLNACGPVIDISPDLSVFRCFALSEIERKRLTDFKNLDDALKYFERTIDEKYSIPTLFEECKKCEFAKNRTCLGGCLVNSPNSIGKAEKTETLMKEAFVFLQDKNFDEAEKVLNKITRKDASSAFLYAHLYYSKGDLENAKRWSMMTINRSKSKKFKNKAIGLLKAIETV